MQISPAFLAGLTLVAFGALLVVRWFFQLDELIGWIPGATQIGLNTPMLLVVAGIGLAALSHTRRPKLQDRVAFVSGALLLVYPAVMLSQTLLGIDLGIDFVREPTAPTPQIPHPGRVAPNTCLALMAAGAFMLLARRPSAARRRAMSAALGLLTLVAGLALAGHLLGLEQLYRVASFNRMLIPTAAALVVLATGLWLFQELRFASLPTETPRAMERRITYRALTTLTVLVLCAGVAGFAVMRETFESSVRDSMRQDTRIHAIALANTLRTSLWFPRTIATRPTVVQTVAALDATPDDARARALMPSLAASFLSAGIDGVRLHDSRGSLIGEAGSLPGDQAKAVDRLTLEGNARGELRWEQGYVLRLQMPVEYQGRRVGELLTEQRLPLVDDLMAALRQTNESSDVLLCSRREDHASCAPTRFYPERFSVPMYDAAGRVNLPINRALLGESGVAFARDLRGVQVVAGYTPVADFGLGLVLKTDVETLYAPLRARLHLVALLVVVLVGAGTLALRSRVRPLLQTVITQQLEQERGQRQLRAIADNLPVMISYIDNRKVLRFLNRTFERWTGIAMESALDRPLEDVIGPGLYAQRADALERALKGERIQFEVESTAAGTRRTLQTVYIPDMASATTVAGVYTLTTDVTALRDAERAMAELARSDTLTGLPNRRCFNERLPEALARAARTQTALALMFLDIDHFKAINDSAGHALGDAVLVEFAQRLEAIVRATDYVARLGGDEFVVLIEGLSAPAEAQLVADKIVNATRAPMILGREQRQVFTSVGVAFLPPGARVDPATLLAVADDALYASKQHGRDRYTLQTVVSVDEPATLI